MNGSSHELEGRVARLSPAKRELLDRELANGPRSGHEWIARTLAAESVSTIYGVPGSPVYGTFAACVKRGLRAIGTHHQQTATLMATAHNYFVGRQAAVALVSSGVAASNALTGVIVARDNGWPLVLLAGAVPREPRDYGHFTELDVETLYRPVTKWTATVQSTSDIARAIQEAFSVAMRGRPGPVVLSLPGDVLNAAAFGAEPRVAPQEDPQVIDASVLDEATRQLRDARRPLLILGKGARWNDAFDDVRRLVDALELPFVTSPIARGYVPDQHAQCFNAVRWAVQRQADVVLLLGARLDWTFRHGAQIAPGASLIQVDVHAAELGRNRVAGLAIHGDLAAFAKGVLARVSGAGATRILRDTAWLDSLRTRRSQAQARLEIDHADSGRRIAPTRFAQALGEALPADAITVLDGNLVLAACERHIAVQRPVHRLTPGSNGCMGSGIPFAIGAALARPSQPVIAVCGDFAFGVSAFEMETAVRHRVPIVVVVANNDGNSGTRIEREMFPQGHRERVSMFGPGLRYSELMRTFGGHAEHVERLEDVKPALRRALAAGVPACINVALDPEAPFPRG